MPVLLLRPCSAEYAALKEERSAVLWAGLEKIIPDIRQRAEVGVGVFVEGSFWEGRARLFPEGVVTRFLEEAIK